MIRRSFFLLMLTLQLGCLAMPVLAADKATKQKLREIEQQLDQQKEHQAALDAAAQQTAENLKGLQQKLIAATENLNAKQEEEEDLADRLDDLNAHIATKTVQMGGEKQKFALLTGALIELSRQPPEALLLRSGLTVDAIHRTMLIRSLLPRMRDDTAELANDLSSLSQMKAEAASRQQRMQEAEQNLQAQQATLDEMIHTRQGLLQRTEKQKAAIDAQLVALGSEAKDLRQLLTRIAPRYNNLHAGAPASSGPALKAPVAGRVVRGFGDRDADGVISEGVTFTALSAAPIVAPRAGKVVFAGSFKGYGKIVILQHSDGYHSFMAGFGRIDAEMDQDVEAGEPLGVMPGATTGEPHMRPTLYFEWRHNNEPVRPADFRS